MISYTPHHSLKNPSSIANQNTNNMMFNSNGITLNQNETHAAEFNLESNSNPAVIRFSYKREGEQIKQLLHSLQHILLNELVLLK